MFSRKLAGFIALVMIAVAAAGCTEDTPPESAPASAGPDPDGWPAVVPAAKGARLTRQTECKDVPIEFDIPDKWLVGYIGTGFGELFPVAGLPLMCEIDSKPGGVIGFLRLWYGPAKPDTKAVLEDYVLQNAEHATDIKYRQTKIGGADAWEVWYQRPKSNIDEQSQGRAFALTVNNQTVVAGWSSVDNADYIAGLPGYALARSTVSPS